MEQQPPEWLSLEAAANVLKVGIPTVQSLINRGLLTTRPECDPPQVPYAALLEFLRQDLRTLNDAGHQPADLGILDREGAS
jgi:hypothetical protein